MPVPPAGETRTLGRTGFAATALSFGAMELRGEPRGRPITPDQAGSVLHAVLDSGINFIDTSIDYGSSEAFIGRWISGRREEFFLASKCGCVVGAPPAPRGERSPHLFTRENIEAGVDQSLARMKTDHLDLVQVHLSPSRQELEQHGVVDTLQRLKQQGKVRFIGMSGTLPHLPDHIAMGVFDAFQIPYSALEREHEELITAAARAGAGTIIRGGVARGDAAGQRGDRWDRWQRAGLDALLEPGENRIQFLLRFTLTHPDVHTVIAGTMNPHHLRENVEAYRRGPLSAQVYAETKRRLEAAA